MNQVLNKLVIIISYQIFKCNKSKWYFIKDGCDTIRNISYFSTICRGPWLRLSTGLCKYTDNRVSKVEPLPSKTGKSVVRGVVTLDFDADVFLLISRVTDLDVYFSR